MSVPNINYDDPVILERYKNFLEKYYDQYSEDLKEDFPKHMGDDIKQYGIKNIYVTMWQIYCAIGLIPDDINIYLAYLDLLIKYHSIGSNILEIGGGPYFLLAIYIDIIQRKIKNGSMTVYDPKLVETKSGNIKAINDFFKEDMSVDNADLLLLIKACGRNEKGVTTTQIALEKSFEHRTDIFMHLCPCSCVDSEENMTPKEAYYQMLIDMISDNMRPKDKFRVLTLLERYGNNNPIISINYNHQR